MKIILLDEVERYIKRLSSAAEKNQVTRYIDRQEELKFLLKRPVSAAIRSGIHELRPGPHRLLFFFHQDSVVICHAFRKKTNKVPAGEVALAISARRDYLGREIR